MWVKRMKVEGSHGDEYTVALNDSDAWGCSCPAWKFKRAPKADCKHIQAVKAGLAVRRPTELRLFRIDCEPYYEAAIAPAVVGVIELDMEIRTLAAALPSATRFAHLDFTVTVL
jgi:hypothetical protein